WPRIGVRKVDPAGAAIGYGYHIGFGYGFGEVYASDEIPQSVKDEQCELALAYLDGFDDGQEDAIDSFPAAAVTVKFRSQRPSGGIPAVVQQLICGLLEGNRLVRA